MNYKLRLLSLEIQALVRVGNTESVGDLLRNLAEEEYRDGYKQAVTNYAVWQNGEQFVGVKRRPLKAVLTEVDEASIPIIW